MYETFYGFREKPFNLTPDPEFIYFSPGHKRVMSYLTYGLENGEGFIAVTGEIGSGKTTLVHNLIKNVHPSVNLAYVVNPRGTFRQLLRIILDELDVVALDEDLPREQLLAAFEKFVRQQGQNGRPVVVIFDEAQNLDLHVLEEIRMLSNIEDEKKKLLQIILIGQPELKDLLAEPELEQLNQRIAVRAHLTPLTVDETQEYIRRRLTVAGDANESVVFTRDACKLIHAYSHGVPRKINIACNAVLLAGFVREKKTFNAAFVREAIADLEESEQYGGNLSELDNAEAAALAAKSPIAKILIGAAITAAGLAAIYVLLNESAFNAIF